MYSFCIDKVKRRDWRNKQYLYPEQLSLFQKELFSSDRGTLSVSKQKSQINQFTFKVLLMVPGRATEVGETSGQEVS